MPTECYLKNDLDVEFISKLAKEKIDTKTKGLVQYMIFDQFWTESFHMTYIIWGIKWNFTYEVLSFESYVQK